LGSRRRWWHRRLLGRLVMVSLARGRSLNQGDEDLTLPCHSSARPVSRKVSASLQGRTAPIPL
jgi:hypothetical protein